MSTLQTVWYLVIAILLIGYTVLDGYDLGVAFWHLGAKTDENRRKLISAIGPFWDANEVWLVTLGGALFAAFPPVYATVFSGFYLALILLLFGLIFRAGAVEFRNHAESARGRAGWDVAFTASSILVVVLLGVALGNLLRGMPLSAQGNYTGSFFDLLNPYAIFLGVVNLAMIATHGALYIALRATGELAHRARRWANGAWGLYLSLAIVAIGYTAITMPLLRANYLQYPLLWALPALALAAIVAIGIFNIRGKAALAFSASVAGIALLLASATTALFPVMVPALGNPRFSLTAANASSTPLTMGIMLAVVGLAIPVLLFYTWWVYKNFGGKLQESGDYYP